ncbi:hypothetical protein PMAYCL1PPCAC_12964, partial [Pristionchus mayeri]
IAALTVNRTRFPDIVEPDQTELLQKLCDDPKLITMLEISAIQGMALVKRPCQLHRIAVISDYRLSKFDRYVMQNFMISRNHTNQRAVRQINLVLLKFFDQDRIENFWTLRFSKSTKYFYTDAKRVPKISIDETFRVMSLRRLTPLFYTTLP